MSPTYTRVRDVMTHHPVMIDGLASVREALELMHATGFSSLIIDRRHPGDEYGILVVTDIAKRVVALDRSAERVSVYEIMTKPVLTVPADMDIKYAIRMLQQFDLSRALVLDAGALVGIVTLREMVMRFLLPAALFANDDPEEPA